jgi:hypothetical protein
VATCARCGTFLCGECTELLVDTAWCATCAELVRRGHATSLSLKLALCLDLLGLASIPFRLGSLLLPLLAAVLGLSLSARELRRLGPAHLPSRARTFALWVRRLAWANLALFTLAVLAFLLLQAWFAYVARGGTLRSPW